MDAFIRDSNLGKVGKSQAGEGGDVRHGESIARQIGLLGKNAVELVHAGDRPIALMLAPFRTLDSSKLTSKAFLELGMNRFARDEVFDLADGRAHVSPLWARGWVPRWLRFCFWAF